MLIEQSPGLILIKHCLHVCSIALLRLVWLVSICNLGTKTHFASLQLSGPCPSPSRAIKLDSKDTKRLIYIKYLAHCRHSTDKLYLDLIVAVSRNIEPGLKNVSKSEPEPEVDLKLEGQNVAFLFS